MYSRALLVLFSLLCLAMLASASPSPVKALKQAKLTRGGPSPVKRAEDHHPSANVAKRNPAPSKRAGPSPVPRK
ncbi:hypothetical protein PLICRDRAFT_40967 [Plicaturopsis crispa FD-325 SS-3]|nr:hypothetical protein PLICRDRAFT_40967 [Plicaturopsis crispa FD-325 SS-3]